MHPTPPLPLSAPPPAARSSAAPSVASQQRWALPLAASCAAALLVGLLVAAFIYIPRHRSASRSASRSAPHSVPHSATLCDVPRGVSHSVPSGASPIVLEAVLPRMRSGDVLLTGTPCTSSALQRFVLRTPVSHAALLYVEAEGTPRAVPWVLQAVSGGVTLTPLWRWFAAADGRVVYYRRLVRRRGAPSLAPRLRRFIDATIGRPYSHGFWQAVAAAVLPPWLPPLPTAVASAAAADEAMFCSQLVVEAWASVGDVLAPSTASLRSGERHGGPRSSGWHSGPHGGPHSASRSVLPLHLAHARAYRSRAARVLRFAPHVGLGRLHVLTSALPPATAAAIADRLQPRAPH